MPTIYNVLSSNRAFAAKNFQDHAPAHFHAWYGDYKIIVRTYSSVKINADMDFLEVIKAQYVGGYKIHLWFNNNIDKVVDFSDKLNGAACFACGW